MVMHAHRFHGLMKPSEVTLHPDGCHILEALDASGSAEPRGNPGGPFDAASGAVGDAPTEQERL